METPARHHPSTESSWSPPLPPATGFTHEIVATPGLRSHVASIGGGEPVVLLHGFPQHWWQWRRIGPALAAAGYRAICPDLRGSGWTEADDPRFSRHTMMHDLVALLDTLGIERAHVLCHDLGAVVGLQFAYAHPERVGAVVQLSVPPGFMAFSPKLMPAFRHMPPLLMHRSGASLEWLFGPEYAAKPMDDATVDGYLRAHRRSEVDRSVRALYRGMVIPEAMHLMRGEYRRMRLRPPTLVVFGRGDGPFSEKTVRRICRNPERHADRFALAFVDDAAHFITDDDPDTVTALARDWFAQAA